MELNQLRYFHALAETLNYTHAAQKCYVSRQALRQAISSLEREYGLCLIENSGNRLSLTQAGLMLQTHVNDLLPRLDALETALHTFGREHPVEIGYSRSLAPFYDPDLLYRLQQLDRAFGPDSYHVQLLTADEIVAGIRHGTLDAGIVVTLGQPMPGLDQTVLRVDNIAILMSAQHPLASCQRLRPADLAGQTLQLMSSAEACFSPLADAVRSLDPPVRFMPVTDLYDVFRNVHDHGMLGLDRCDRNHDMSGTPISREVDLPLTDFPYQLSTVFMTASGTASPQTSALLKYLQSRK